ncbi:DUF5711 family protein [Oscillibacter sp.]|uniref:DUF5711 family protein n=1 Tax=Oscillibacter sp. TaxID=1945593 RepID=UPI0026024BA6|nr:DUF5711 family protein [Oscillibacter sp.]MDD3347920.1 DUF5711 family protein [Oscillibacter sp.]
MTETTKDIWNDDDGEEKGKKHHRFRSFLIFFLTLTVVLGVVLLAAYRDGTGFDVLRRYFNYGRVEKVGGDTVYDYDASASNRFAVLGDRLVVLSSTSLQLLDESGETVWSTSVKMEAPAIAAGGGRAVAYDVGGKELYLLDENGQLMTLSAQEGEAFIAATLNQKGQLALTAQKKNYKGCVSVYNEKQEKIFEFNSSRRFVIDAYVTDDGAYLAAVTLGQENSVFVSNVVLYDVTKKDPVADYDVSDGLVAAIGQQGESIATVSDTCLTFADEKGKVLATYPYNGGYLREFDLGGDGFSVLLLNRYQTGSVGRLVTVGADGAERGTLEVQQEVLDLAVSGRYLAVLYTDSLVIYNEELQVYASLKGTDYAKSVLMRPDGSALLISSESASLFLP